MAGLLGCRRTPESDLFGNLGECTKVDLFGVCIVRDLLVAVLGQPKEQCIRWIVKCRQRREYGSPGSSILTLIRQSTLHFGLKTFRSAIRCFFTDSITFCVFWSVDTRILGAFFAGYSDSSGCLWKESITLVWAYSNREY